MNTLKTELYYVVGIKHGLMQFVKAGPFITMEDCEPTLEALESSNFEYGIATSPVILTYIEGY